jgi:hypothetical protein
MDGICSTEIEARNAYKVLLEALKGRDSLGDVGIGESR